jgi:phytoene dehydrogenase-like protein
MKLKYDVVVIGAGHNGLVAACYLARHGLTTINLESADRVGGACNTDEILPGFRVSGAAQMLGMLRPEVTEDLQLKRHGLQYRRRDPEMFVPYPDGQHLFLYSDRARTIASIDRLSPHDAAAYASYDEYTERIGNVLSGLIGGPTPSLEEVISAFDRDGDREMLQILLFESIRDYLERWFDSDYVKGPLAYGALSGMTSGPDGAGTAFNKLYQSSRVQLAGCPGSWALVQGGMGSVTEALFSALRSLGGEVELSATVDRIQCKGGKATGVVLKDGREISAEIVLSNADPKRTYLDLIPPDALPHEFRQRAARIKQRGTGFKVNFALAELPNFVALPSRDVGPQHTGGVLIAPSLDYFERAWDDAKYGRPSSQPFVHFIIQSATDPSLAPVGQHTVSVWGNHFPYRLAQGDLAVERERHGDRITDLISEYAPNFRQAVLARQVWLPMDIETRYGMTGGQILHGDLMPSQALWGRPFVGSGGHRTPVGGVYLCGAGTHPGGDVSGAPGRNAAMAVLADLGARQHGIEKARPMN